MKVLTKREEREMMMTEKLHTAKKIGLKTMHQFNDALKDYEAVVKHESKYTFAQSCALVLVRDSIEEIGNNTYAYREYKTYAPCIDTAILRLSYMVLQDMIAVPNGL